MGPGATGPDVLKWQNILIAAGYTSVKADGVYGNETEAATKKYQTVLGVTADGVVGQETWDAYALKAGITGRQLDEIVIKARSYVPVILISAVIIGGLIYYRSRQKKKKAK